MKMNHLISVLLVIMLVMISAAPALALTGVEKEQQYAAAIDQLATWLEGGHDVAELQGIYSAFYDLGGYSHSRFLAYYADVLLHIEEGQFDFDLEFSLKMLEQNAAFCDYLTDELHNSLGDIPQLRAYVTARGLEQEGKKTEAVEQYKNCLSYYDSAVRYERLAKEELSGHYDKGVELMKAGDLIAAFTEFSMAGSWKDSTDRLAFIEDTLGYNPLTHAHSWQPATCTLPKTCTGCGNTEGEALGHKWDEGMVSNPATCISDGVMTYTCSTCGEKRDEYIPQYGDNHAWQPATCTTPKTCRICGAVEGEALEHKWDNGKLTTKATCISEGVITYTCTVCGKTKVNSRAKNLKNHTGGTEIRNAASATCSKNGYSGDTYCKGCGEKIMSGSSIPAIGHMWDDGTVITPATCAKEGVKMYACRVCQNTENRSIPKNMSNHVGGTYVVGASEATCSHSGYSGDLYCNGCGNLCQRGTKISAKKHSYGDWYTVREATRSRSGLRRRVCKYCGASEDWVIAPY